MTKDNFTVTLHQRFATPSDPATSSDGLIDTVVEHTAKYVYDGDSFSCEEVSRETFEYDLESYASSMFVPVTLLEILLKAADADYTIDRAANRLTIVQKQEREPESYRYDSQADQYIHYLTYKGKYTSASYVLNDPIHYQAMALPFFEEAILHGTVDQDDKTIDVAFSDGFKQSETYRALSQNGEIFAGMSIAVQDNFPASVSMVPEEGYEEKASCTLTYEDVDSSTVDLPEGEVSCGHHETCHLITPTDHCDYCAICGLRLTPVGPHDFDPDTGVCFACGQVEGLATDRGEGGGEMKFAIPFGEGGYALGYYENALGEIYNVETYPELPEGASPQGDYLDEGCEVAYIAELGVMVVATDGEGEILDGECLTRLSIRYDFYDGIAFTMEEDTVLADGKTIAEYLATATAKQSVTGYRVYPNHDLPEDFASTPNDACVDYVTAECALCHQCEASYAEHHHALGDLEKLTMDEFFDEVGKAYASPEQDDPFPETEGYYKFVCPDCGKTLYFSYPYADENHDTEPAHIECYIKDGLRINRIDNSMTAPHIDDGNGNCLFCGISLA